MKSNLSIYSCCLFLVSYLRTCCLIQSHREWFTPVLSLEFYSFNSYVFNPLWVNFANGMRKGYSFLLLHVHIQLSKLFSQLLNNVLCLCRTFQGGKPGQNLPGQCGHLNWPRKVCLILLISALYYDKTRHTVRYFFLTMRTLWFHVEECFTL